MLNTLVKKHYGDRRRDVRAQRLVRESPTRRGYIINSLFILSDEHPLIRGTGLGTGLVQMPLLIARLHIQKHMPPLRDL